MSVSVRIQNLKTQSHQVQTPPGALSSVSSPNGSGPFSRTTPSRDAPGFSTWPRGSSFSQSEHRVDATDTLGENIPKPTKKEPPPLPVKPNSITQKLNALQAHRTERPGLAADSNDQGPIILVDNEPIEHAEPLDQISVRTQIPR